MFRFLPEQASEIAPSVDWLNNVIMDISVFFTVAICGAMIYFAVRYRAKENRDHDTPRIHGSHLLEAIWTIVPTIIVIFVGYYGIVIFKELRAVPQDARTIMVTGKKWSWSFKYEENGKLVDNEAVIPVGEPIKFVLTSTDVLHSFFVPAMRVKSDAIPNRYTYVAFTPVKTGDYHIFCTEYCGTDHSAMRARLKVVPKADYARWLASDQRPSLPPAEWGKQLFGSVATGGKGCETCHSLDGTRRVGPTFLDLFGKEEPMEDGSVVKVDEDYIRTSILYPAKQIVATYPNAMTAFEGQITEDQIGALIAFMKTVTTENMKAQEAAAPAADEAAAPAQSADATPEERGKALYTSKTCVACHSLDGSRLVGPSFKGLYGKNGKLADGTAYTADDAYLTKSIKDPNSQVVEGYPAAMVIPPITDAEISDLVAYIKTVK